MASAHDVAAYILERCGNMTAMKLQKLVYYSQAWHLVWDEEPLFSEEIQAWANGPVIPQLYREHRGRFQVDSWPGGDSASLTDSERETIDAVIAYYGKRSAHWLSELSHRERPWRDAREKANVPTGARSDAVITIGSMFEYYDGLTSADR